MGTAIATIGSNMPDVGRGVSKLAALMPEQRGDLVEAARRLCGAFSDFLTTVNPEHGEKRTTVLAAAGRVGDFSQQVISTIEEPTPAQASFHDGLVQRAKHVATSTAQLVLRFASTQAYGSESLGGARVNRLCSGEAHKQRDKLCICRLFSGFSGSRFI